MYSHENTTKLMRRPLSATSWTSRAFEWFIEWQFWNDVLAWYQLQLSLLISHLVFVAITDMHEMSLLNALMARVSTSALKSPKSKQQH